MKPLRAVALASMLAALSCKSHDAPDAHYAVRGEVEDAEGKGEEARALIHHEAIPKFKDRDGKPSDMASMQMNFALSEGVTVEMLKPGSKVAIEFDVHWNLGDPLVITKVTPLPSDTPLSLH